MAAAAPLLALAAAGSLASAWSRPAYIANAVQDLGWQAAAGQLTLASVMILGYLISSARGATRVACILLAAAYLLYYFGMGTRSLALFPLLFCLGGYAATRSSAWTRAVVLSSALAVYLIRLPLYLRHLPSHGIANYVHYLPEFFSQAPPWLTSVKNILVSYPIIGRSYLSPPIPRQALWISVNPLPGGSVGWYELAPTLRINVYTPFAAVGEVGNQGWGTVLIYWAVVGVVLALLDRQVLRLYLSGRRLLPLPIVGLVALFLLYSVQYNLRSSVRVLYYALVAWLIIEILVPRLGRRRSVRSGWSPGGAKARVDASQAAR